MVSVVSAAQSKLELLTSGNTCAHRQSVCFVPHLNWNVFLQLNVQYKNEEQNQRLLLEPGWSVFNTIVVCQRRVRVGFRDGDFPKI